MPTILVTDTLFIQAEHEQRLRDAGYAVARLGKPDATAQELIEAIAGKVGYVIGGLEQVTTAVVDAADELTAIVFTGTSWQGYIPGWRRATERGIAIANAPSVNAPEVAEWALAAMLAMQRNLFSLGPQSRQKFCTVNSLTELEVGVVGLGEIGRRFAEHAAALNAKSVSYWSREKKTDQYDYHDTPEDLLRSADVVLLAVSDEAGQDFVDRDRISLMKDGALLVSVVHQGIVDEDALHQRLSEGTLRAAFDVVKDVERFRQLPSDTWYGSNATTAYNVESAHRRISDMAADSILNLLADRGDPCRVNQCL